MSIFEHIDAGDIDSVRACLDEGTNVEASDGGRTPLFHAVGQARLEICDLLLERGAAADAKFRGDGESVLQIACQYGRAAKRNGRPMSDDDKADCLPAIVDLLIAAGVDVNDRGSSESPIEHAAQYANEAVVGALLDAGADPNVWKHQQPLRNAILSRHAHLEKTLRLLKAGAKVDGKTLRAAIHRPREPTLIEALLRAGGAEYVNECDHSNWTALTYAVAAEDPKTVGILLSHGARADIPINEDAIDAGLARGMTAADIALEFELDEVHALLGAERRSADEWVGRWQVFAGQELHDEDDVMLSVDQLEDRGCDHAYLDLQAGGKAVFFLNSGLGEVTGEWSFQDGVSLQVQGIRLERAGQSEIRVYVNALDLSLCLGTE